jgi:hypothetical protein
MMMEEEWRACVDPDIMKEFLRGGLSHRKLRLFTVEGVRPFWDLLIDSRSRDAVMVAEQVAEHADNKGFLEHAFRAAFDAIPQLPSDRDAHVTAAHAAGRTVDTDPVWACDVAWNMIA